MVGVAAAVGGSSVVLAGSGVNVAEGISDDVYVAVELSVAAVAAVGALVGGGTSVCDGVKTPVEPDVALWVRAGEMHQLINDGEETLKLATVFVPGYTVEQNLGRIRQAAKDAQRK